MLSGILLFLKEKHHKFWPKQEFFYFDVLACQPFCNLMVQNCTLNIDLHDIKSFPQEKTIYYHI